MLTDVTEKEQSDRKNITNQRILQFLCDMWIRFDISLHGFDGDCIQGTSSEIRSNTGSISIFLCDDTQQIPLQRAAYGQEDCG